VPLIQTTGKLFQDNFSGGVAAINKVAPGNFTVGNTAVVTFAQFDGSATPRIIAVKCGGNIGALDKRQPDGTNENLSEIWRVPILVGGSNAIVIDTDAGTGQFVTFSVDEFDDIAENSLDQTGATTQNSSATPTVTASGASNTPDQYVFAAFTDYLGTNWTSVSATGATISWSETNGTVREAGAAAYKSVSAVGVQSLQFTAGAAVGNIGTLVTYRRAPGGSGLGYDFTGSVAATRVTNAFNSQATGSIILACVGRGVSSYFGTTAVLNDNKGNGNFPILGTSHNYTAFPTSGTALYAKVGAAGGSGHVISTNKPDTADEVTVIAIELPGVDTIVDHQWVERTSGPTNTSAVVSMNGPGLLAAFWWGTDSNGELFPAVPSDWSLLKHTSSLASNHVQAAVAIKRVTAAGVQNHSIVWTPSTSQGAQLYIVAARQAGAPGISNAGNIASEEAFGVATVSGIATPYNGSGMMIGSTTSFVGASMIGSSDVPATGYTVSNAGSIASAEAFGAPTLALGKTITSTGAIASAEAFGVPTLALGLTITSAGAIVSAEAFGTATVSGGASGTISNAGGIASAEAFGVPTLAAGVAVSNVGAIASAEAFGTPALAFGATISNAGAIASAEAFGVPSLIIGATIIGAGAIPSAEAFGLPTTSGATTATLSNVGAIASAEAFGTPTLALGTTISNVGAIASAEAFGVPSIGGSTSATLSNVGAIASAEAFGTPSISAGIAISNAGAIVSAEAFGTATISGAASGAVSNAGAIPSSEAFGAPTLQLGITASNAGGIASTEAFGVPTIGAGITITGAGAIPSAEAFGAPTITGVVPGQIIGAGGIASAEAFGIPSIATTGGNNESGGGAFLPRNLGVPIIRNPKKKPALAAQIRTKSIASAEAFGTPTVTGTPGETREQVDARSERESAALAVFMGDIQRAAAAQLTTAAIAIAAEQRAAHQAWLARDDEEFLNEM
jgi:hypothetical protein